MILSNADDKDHIARAFGEDCSRMRVEDGRMALFQLGNCQTFASQRLERLVLK